MLQVPEQIVIDWGPRRVVFSVSELTEAIAGLLGESFADIWVSGEISGLKIASSGHAYFTLKDDKAQIRCACFRNALRIIKFRPQDGMAVAARGRVDVYAARGEYQLIVEVIEPQGVGALQMAFEQLKKTLEAEGLFAAARKRPLPAFPRRIGIVTSPAGAVIRDMLNILTRRFPGLHIRLYPAMVQGAGSADAVAEGIRHFSEGGWADIVIVGRGGGSLEDLWTFNEEAVARAIAACSVPVVSAVGHETDFTISDFVADMRAPTPSAAAELVVPERDAVMSGIEVMEARLGRALHFRVVRMAQRMDELLFRLHERARRRIEAARRAWQELEARLQGREPRLQLAAARTRVDSANATLAELIRRRLEASRRTLDRLHAGLVQLSPLAVLERGYAVVQTEAGAIVRSSADVAAGDALRVRLHQGRLGVRVESKTNN
jgi:exodeoxyribonuclease VII large subunit